MKEHGRLLTRPWMLPAGIVVLIAGPAILYYLLSHTALSAAVVSGVITVIVLKHLGLLGVLLGPVYAVFRRRTRRTNTGDKQGQPERSK